MRRVFGWETVHDHFISRLERIARPASPRQPVRASRFTGPVHYRAVVLSDIHVIMHVRVLPVDASHHAFERNRLGLIVLIGERMMGEQALRSQEKVRLRLRSETDETYRYLKVRSDVPARANEQPRRHCAVGVRVPRLC